MADQQNPETQTEATEPAKKSSVWDAQPLKTLKIAFNTAAVITSPIWWPTKKLGQFGFSGIKQKSIVKPVFAAAALGTYLGIAAYGAAYGVIVANETRVFGMNGWPATQGHWTGTIARFSEKGTAPCNSYEGNIRTAEAADSEKFSVRQFDKEIIQAVKDAGKASVLLVYRDSGLDQESFGKITDMGKDFDEIDPTWWLGCIQHTDHNVVGVHYTHPQTGERVSVGLQP